MKLSSRVIINGLIAGLLGASAVAIWFLIFDATRGHMFETPALLSAVLLHGAHRAAVRVAPMLVLEYSVLHFAAFALVGVAIAWLIEMAEREPPVLVSLIIFSVAFEVFFLALVMFIGPAVMREISWWSILVGNLLATAAIFSFLFWRHETVGRGWLTPWVGVLKEGILAGFIGAFVVAVWFLVYDAVAGQPFRTPALLGATIFAGLRDPSGLQIAPAFVIGYTVLHVMAFVTFGLAAAFVIEASEREPILLLGVFMLFACFEVIFFGVVTLADSSLLESLGWWAIVVGNLVAAVAMLGFFFIRHRALHVRLVERWASQE
jgi:hypothetical protein